MTHINRSTRSSLISRSGRFIICIWILFRNFRFLLILNVSFLCLKRTKVFRFFICLYSTLKWGLWRIILSWVLPRKSVISYIYMNSFISRSINCSLDRYWIRTSSFIESRNNSNDIGFCLYISNWNFLKGQKSCNYRRCFENLPHFGAWN